MKKKYFIAVILSVVLLVSFAGEYFILRSGTKNQGFSDSHFGSISYTNRDTLFRNGKFTKIRGDGTDIVTVMIYICGSDLESEGQAASADINEILNAGLSDNINVIIQTGGSLEWHTDGISPDSVTRFAVVNHQLKPVDDIGRADILSSEVLSDFITFSAENYPADRYELIFWDHGSGAVYGFGADENNPGSALTSDKIDKALSDAGIKFDFIGFDACIMANLETALMLSRYADYFIASEEIEPAGGWYYTDFLTHISEYPSADTIQIAENIIDDYIFTARLADSFNGYTMSVTDLEKLSMSTYPLFCGFFSSLCERLSAGEYDKIAQARAKSLEFAFEEYSHIDFADFVGLAEDEYSERLVKSISSAVEYHKETPGFENVNGLTLYFPYKYIHGLERMLEIYKSLNFGGEYCKFISEFLSIMAGGKIFTANMHPQHGAVKCSKENDRAYWESFSWFNNHTVSNYSGYYTNSDAGLSIEKHKEDYGEIYTVDMSDNFRKSVTGIKPEFYIYDGSQYIDLGSDARIYSSENGTTVVETDYCHIALNDITVPFYREYGRGGQIGFVPAVINGVKRINIMIFRDEEYNTGCVAGYRYQNEDTPYIPSGRGMMKFKKGDTVEFLFKCYDSSGEYMGEQLIGGAVTIGDEMPSVSYKIIEPYNVCVYFLFSDIYNNIFYTDNIKET